MGQEGQEQRKVGSVTYQEVGEEYFEKRGLRRHAGVWSLWALGVGAVISGEFYGWNFGLGTGGFGGLAIAGVLMAIMYYGLVYSIAEMSPALPHTGGAYSFARSAMGPWGGFLTGLAENAEYVITPAVVVGAMALLMQEIVGGLFDVTGDPFWNSLPFWALIFYVIFVGINIVGIEATMRFTVTITLLSLAVLAFFILAAIFSGKLDFNLWTNIAKDGAEIPGGGGPALPFGISGIFKSLPFAIWFFLAIEEVPLAAEESMDPRRDVPKGSVWGMHTLLIAAILILVFNTALPGGAFLYGASGFPLLDGLYAIFGQNSATELLGLLFMIGLVASFFTIIFAYGRNTYSLSRAGYFPKFLSQTHGVRKTPHVALIAGAVVGYAVFFLVWALQQQELRRADRGGAAQHGGLRRGDLVHHADGVVRPAPQEAAEHRAAVPEQGGRPGRGGRRAAGRDLARGDLPERGVSARRLRRGHLLRARRPVLRRRGTEPARPVSGGGVRPHAGPAGRAAVDVRDGRGRAGGDPARRVHPAASTTPVSTTPPPDEPSG